MVDPKMISLYQLLHDWWGVGACIIGGYRLWKWINSFKDTTDRIEGVVQEMSARIDAHQVALKQEVSCQTSALVSEFREMRNDFRTMFMVAQPRPLRARRVVETKKKKLDSELSA